MRRRDARLDREFRRRAGAAALGFGRTRIGIETGQAIVGDVGLRAKLDYTAHGDAVNSAARHEAANKALGSTICVGPATAARCDAGAVPPARHHLGRGRDGETAAVFEPWPPDAPPQWRERYLAAFALMDGDPRAPPSCSRRSPPNFQATRWCKYSPRSLRSKCSLSPPSP